MSMVNEFPDLNKIRNNTSHYAMSSLKQMVKAQHDKTLELEAEKASIERDLLNLARMKAQREEELTQNPDNSELPQRINNIVAAHQFKQNYALPYAKKNVTNSKNLEAQWVTELQKLLRQVEK